MALYHPPVRLVCDTIFTDTCQLVRIVLPILATLTLTAGLLMPAAGVAWMRRMAGGRATPSQVDPGRGTPRLTPRHPAAFSAAQMPDPELDDEFAGPVAPADPIVRSLESGWWLTPPAGAVVCSQMPRGFCAASGNDRERLLLRASVSPSGGASCASPGLDRAVRRSAPIEFPDRAVSPVSPVSMLGLAA